MIEPDYIPAPVWLVNRFGGGCAVPGCGQRRRLAAYQAGEEQVPVCLAHLRALWTGHVRVVAATPKSLRWEIGVPGRPPLLVLDRSSVDSWRPVSNHR